MTFRTIRNLRLWFVFLNPFQLLFGNAGGQDQDDKTTQTGTPPANGGSGSGGQSGQGGSEDPNLLKLSTAQLAERLDRAKNSAVSELLKTLGFEKAEDLKTLVDQAKQAQEASKTELEKAQTAATKAKADLEAAQQQNKDLEAARLADKLDSAITEAAKGSEEYGTKTLHAYNAKDVIGWARNESGEDLTKLLSSDGVVDGKAVGELVKKAHKARPHYFQTAGPGSPSNRGGSAPEPNAEEKKKAAQAQAQNLRNRF